MTADGRLDKMFRYNFQEERTVKDSSKLQAVFSKLSGVRPRVEDLGNSNNKTMTTDIIESVLTEASMPVQNYQQQDTYPAFEEHAAMNLATRLEGELRAAKRTHLACGEVLLPCGLLQRISRDVISMAESEPCGLRGCILYLDFETDQGEPCRRLGTLHCDPETAPTFELYLTLKQSAGGWNFIPQFLRNLTKGGTVVLSPAYVLKKKKLYGPYVD